MNKPLFIILLLISIQLSGQNKVKIQIESVPIQPFTLANFYGDQNHILDTITPDTNGIIEFEMYQSYFDGMYRLGFNKDFYLDFIFGHEDIEMKTHFNGLIDSMQVINSKENEIYFNYLKRVRKYYLKMDLLAPLVNYYPEPEDDFYPRALEEFENNQLDFIDFIDQSIEDNPELFVSKILKQQKPIYLEASLNDKERIDFLREHYFDHMSFDDPELMRTNVYTAKSIDYISLYSNPQLGQDQLEEQFILAVDRIMEEASANSIIYEFVIEYLVGGFEAYHFDKVLDYIAENYAPEQCENMERKTDLQSRLEKYSELTVGKDAPDFSNIDAEEKPILLSEIDADYTLLVFWASWCPHCSDMMPQLKSLYNQMADPGYFEIITVSLDTSKVDWIASLDKDQATWISTCDSKGWDSDAAIAYNIYATPTMFLLDQNKKIIAKPITYEGLINDIITLEIIKP